MRNVNINANLMMNDWEIVEQRYDPNNLGKSEALFSLGNGYMGLRSSNEEKEIAQTRGLFIAGTYNKAFGNEVTELPNFPDLINMDIYLGDELFSLEKGRVMEYSKSLNYRHGLLTREILWESPEKNRYHLTFERFVSLSDHHLLGQKVKIRPLRQKTRIDILTTTDGQVTNTGAQHFEEVEKRLFNDDVIGYIATTNQSRITGALASRVRIHSIDKKKNHKSSKIMERRKVGKSYTINAAFQEEIVIEKISSIFTTRDLETMDLDADNLLAHTKAHLDEIDSKRFQDLLENSRQSWESYWSSCEIEIDSTNALDQYMTRIAQYHLRIMTPFHDNRMSVAAKGLSGEGYKGHVFWDTEVFIFPYFLYLFEDVSRQLLEFRYLNLKAAKQNAMNTGFKGARYPWEAAWIDDVEVTPEYGDVDIVTGKPQKIATGELEIHVTADIAMAVLDYYRKTNDYQFMIQCGYEMILETALFWYSKLEKALDGSYHINNVIGPDEYKEHVNDNAFTNYLAHMNMSAAIELYNDFCVEKQDERAIALSGKTGLNKVLESMKDKVDNLYLPVINERGILPQDDSYLQKNLVELTKYYHQKEPRTIMKDYSIDQINGMQVTKQADVLLLLLRNPQKYSEEILRKNWDYYAPKTLHDSSLSLATHIVLASRLRMRDHAYKLYHELYNVDIGPNMKSSDLGIHAAAMGGIWQSVIHGFCGVSIDGENLVIEPQLPDEIKRVAFPMRWKGKKKYFEVTKQKVKVKELEE